MRGISWALTFDHLGGKKMQNTSPAMIHDFKLYDDDGVLYFSGAMTDKLYNSDGEGIFEPLDYCMSEWGCTEIRIVNPATGKYETI